MGCVYSNQRFGSKRKSQNGESSSNSTAAAIANGVELQTSADPSRWNHSVQQNGGGGHFVADSANCASSVPFGSVFGGLSTTTPTTLGTTIGSTMATSPADRSHIFNACLMNDDLNELHHGKLEITDQSLIFRTKGQQMATVWPLKYLRKYGSNNDIFSFECGRRCSTGEGVYAFKCSNAEQLFQLLSDVIATLNSFATTLNAVNGQLASSNVSNGSLPTHHLHHHPVQQQSHGLSSLSHSHQQQQPHSHLLSSNLAECCHGPNGANNLHHSHLPEYQNLAPFTSTADSSDGSRPHSSLESGPHTYLNSATSGAALNPNNVINSGIKSQPNYYTSNPHNHSNGSLNGYLSDKKLVFLTGSDPQSQSQLFQQCSSTLPASIKSAKNSQNSHEYVNSNVFTNNSNNFSAKTMVPQTRRKSNDQHLYENHELPILHSIKPKKLEEIRSKMTASDDLGTFCYVNIGSEPRKDRMAYIQAYNLNKSARTTPEPQCYIQLDLNNKSTADDPSEPRLVLNETAAATAEQSQQPQQQQQPAQLANNSPEKNSMENLDSITSNTSARSKQGKSLRDELKQSSRSRNQSSDSGIRKNSSSGPSNNSEANKQPSATTVPYAQIDFAKTLALSNSAANHRKL